MIWTDDWARIMHPQIDRVLDCEGTRAVVAYASDEPKYSYGWIAGDTTERTPIVFFVYVLEAHRKRGIARRLLDKLGVDPLRPFTYVCRTAVMKELHDKMPFARYNPKEVRWPKEARRTSWPK
jgi:hypothetical protein